jgi:hypothetical protein
MHCNPNNIAKEGIYFKKKKSKRRKETKAALNHRAIFFGRKRIKHKIHKKVMSLDRKLSHIVIKSLELFSKKESRFFFLACSPKNQVFRLYIYI